MTARLIRQRILEMLDVAGAGGLPDSILLKGLNTEIEPPLTADEVAAHLHWLIDRRMVDTAAEGLDDDGKRRVITRVGKGALKQ